MTEGKKISRKTLARYAGLLGRESIAADALRFYDNVVSQGAPTRIVQRNNGFTVWVDLDDGSTPRRFG